MMLERIIYDCGYNFSVIGVAMDSKHIECLDYMSCYPDTTTYRVCDMLDDSIYMGCTKSQILVFGAFDGGVYIVRLPKDGETTPRMLYNTMVLCLELYHGGMSIKNIMHILSI